MEKVKKSFLYTGTGDEGTSQLFNGERLEKDHVVFECLGDVDEVNCYIGLVRVKLQERGSEKEASLELKISTILEWLIDIQSRLLDIGKIQLLLSFQGFDSVLTRK